MGTATAAGGFEIVAGLQEFFAMGGHGLYVWLSYALSWSVILVFVWRLRVVRRTFVRQARARAQRLQAELNGPRG
jgi:heme exporter protein D